MLAKAELHVDGDRWDNECDQQANVPHGGLGLILPVLSSRFVPNLPLLPAHDANRIPFAWLCIALDQLG
jgi:hypothetical protein